jgi:hypothetical protein
MNFIRKNNQIILSKLSKMKINFKKQFLKTKDYVIFRKKDVYLY